MPEVTGYTAERMKEIEDNCVVNGDIVGGHLILTKFDDSELDAGPITENALVDTLANLASDNPIVDEGRLVVASNSTPQIHAFGDGINQWLDLPKYREFVAIPKVDVARVAGAHGDRQSTVYGALPVPLQITTFTKLLDETRLIVTVSGQVIIEDALENAYVAVDIGGTDTEMFRVDSYTTDYPGYGMGTREFDGIPAGALGTVAVQWRTSTTNAGIFQIGTWTLKIEETY